MTTKITSKGQITIPLRLRLKFHLNVGDQLEFDENAPVLTARRVVNRAEWEKTLHAWRKSAAKVLERHPWNHETASAIIDEMRGGPADRTRPPK